MYIEYLDFIEYDFKKITNVSSSKNNYILMNIDIDFFNVPCFALRVFLKTSVGSIDELDIFQKLKWQHLDNKNEVQYDF